jgi:hypothetical protein
MSCQECYSEHPRITPLKGAQDCLTNHLQYICSTCGRVICIGPKGAKKARCLMPFGSLEQARLYLKAAETMLEDVCGIYELIYKRGDKRYRVFKNSDDLKAFLKRTPTVKCENYEPVHISSIYHPVSPDQIRHLTREEVQQYLSERKIHNIVDK